MTTQEQKQAHYVKGLLAGYRKLLTAGNLEAAAKLRFRSNLLPALFNAVDEELGQPYDTWKVQP